MVNMSIFNASSKLESQILSYNQDTKFYFKSWYCLHMCSIGKSFNQMLLSSVDDIIYEHIESVY